MIKNNILLLHIILSVLFIGNITVDEAKAKTAVDNNISTASLGFSGKNSSWLFKAQADETKAKATVNNNTNANNINASSLGFSDKNSNWLFKAQNVGLAIINYLNGADWDSGLYHKSKGSSASNVKHSGNKKPNVIFILTDDQDKNSLNATTMPRTWNFIKKQGVFLPNHILPIPTCCPSRSSFLSGQYGHNNSVRTNGGAYGGFSKYYAKERRRGLGWGYNIGSFMKHGGYRTAMIGKYLNNYGERYRENIPGTAPKPVVGWDKWFATIRNGGQKYYNYKVRFNGGAKNLGPDRKATEDTWIDKANSVIHFPAPECYSPDGCVGMPDIIDKQKRSYSERIYVNQTIRFLKKNRSGKPSFVWYAADTPHGTGDKTIYNHGGTWGSASYSPKDQFRFTKIPKKFLIPSPAFNERKMFSKPLFMKRSKRFSSRKRGKILLHSRARWKSLYSLDRELGRLYRYLVKSGKAKNTILVFTSDNGYMTGEHRIPKGKVRPYTEASEFPILYRGPGIQKNVSIPLLTANIDFLPTVLGLTGVSRRAVRDPFSNRSNPIDGMDISSFLKQDSAHKINERKGIFISSTPGYDVRPFKPYKGVRSRDFLYIRYYQKNKPKKFFYCRNDNACLKGMPELYNLKRDPYQRKNLIFVIRKNFWNPEWRENNQLLLNKFSEMKKLFFRLKRCSGESCRR